MSEWTRKDFQRRSVTVAEGALVGATGHPARIEIAIIVDGVQLVRMQAREPGLVACYAHVESESFVIDVVEPSRGQYRDVKDMPGGGRGESEIEDWHAHLMGLEK